MSDVPTELCTHCRYRIPSDASICPGCARRHVPASGPSPGSGEHSPLLRQARWARRLLVVAGWGAAAFGAIALTRYVAGLDRVADRLSEATLERLTELTGRLAWVALVALVLAAAGTWTWARRSHRNLRPLGLEPRWDSPWSLLGWMVPGRSAVEAKRAVDGSWRDNSPLVAALPATGWSRRPVSRVVLRWWSLWAWVPAVGVLVAVVLDTAGSGDAALRGELPLGGVAAAALVVVAVRALYDVIGIVTAAQAHRAAEVRNDRQSHLEGSGDDGEPSSTASTSSGVATTV